MRLTSTFFWCAASSNSCKLSVFFLMLPQSLAKTTTKKINKRILTHTTTTTKKKKKKRRVNKSLGFLLCFPSLLPLFAYTCQFYTQQHEQEYLFFIALPHQARQETYPTSERGLSQPKLGLFSLKFILPASILLTLILCALKPPLRNEQRFCDDPRFFDGQRCDAL